MRAEIWAPEGKEPRVSLTLTADAILPLRSEKQPREKGPTDAPRRSALSQSPNSPHGWRDTDRQLSDDIPF